MVCEKTGMYLHGLERIEAHPFGRTLLDYYVKSES
tara:strand:+ start:81 stop:185 length:105 start_codon:yes stop_codon:yes gene_type:complete